MGWQLQRRGPDDEQILSEGPLTVVFRRLAIVDVPGGRQPFRNPQRQTLALVNGEIYNHRDLRRTLEREHALTSHSDCAVVLPLFEELGAEALHRLRGMFALMIWDGAHQRLFLARDRLGIKPLFYAQVGHLLLFASELKALWAHPSCPSTLDFGDFSVVQDPIHALPSYVKDVRMLPGGHWLSVTEGRLEPVRRWWSIHSAIEASRDAPPLPVETWAERYADLFDEALERHLMSDVPVGAFLSGGLDSCLVVSRAARTLPGLHCFSALEPTTAAVGDAQRAEALATRLQLPFHPVRFDHRTVLDELRFTLETFEYFVWMAERPHFDIEWFMKHELHRYAKTQVPSLKVMLLGQGADEFAGGYSHMLGTPRSNWATYQDSLDQLSRFLFKQRHHVPEEWMRLLSGRAWRPPEGYTLFQHDLVRRTENLQIHHLWHEDRTSSAQGVEARVPFLDHVLVEFLASLPASIQPEACWDKRILRLAARRWLGPAESEQRKVGFLLSEDVRTSVQLRRKLCARVFPEFRQAYLAGADSLLDADAMDGLFRRTRLPGAAGAQASAMLLNAMALAVFERLCRTLRREDFVRGMPAPSPLRTDRITVFDQDEDVRKEPSLSEWPVETRVSLAEGVAFLGPSRTPAGAGTLFITQDGVFSAEVEFEPGKEALVRIALDLQASEGRTIREVLLAEPEHGGQALELLFRHGWLQPVS